jgi:thiamine kinase-like enzyme
VPEVLRSLHALPPFARAPFNTTSTFLLNQGPALDGFLQKFREAKLLTTADSEELFARYAEVAAVYPWDDAGMVSSHNDLFKPDNMLFDGQRVWLVDWEAAFLNDRYTDLAVVANLVVTSETEEGEYLERYFGAPPTRYQRARFFLMQQLSHIFYTLGFLYLGSLGTTVDWSETVPAYNDFQRRFWAGEIEVVEPQMKIAYGRVHWAQLREDVRRPRYREALQIVRQR